MPELQARKVGIVACSGEELAEGTVTRLAALRVLEQLRPGRTVTICLPLFLAGGEGDRAFARYYPTIALDGCEQRCAARATEQLSGKPAASVVVTDLLGEAGLPRPRGARRLDETGRRATDIAADRVAGLVDDLLGAPWSRHAGAAVEEPSSGPEKTAPPAPQPGCACAAAIPVQAVEVAGETLQLAALPLIFDHLLGLGRVPGPGLSGELLELVKVYNDVPPGIDEGLAEALQREYAAHCRAGGSGA